MAGSCTSHAPKRQSARPAAPRGASRLGGWGSAGASPAAYDVFRMQLSPLPNGKRAQLGREVLRLSAGVAGRAGRHVEQAVALGRLPWDVGIDLAVLGEQLERAHRH